MNQEMEESKELPSLKEFVFPPDDIRQSVSDLEIYWQLSNQAGVKLYTKWQGKDWFVLHSFRELHDYIETKELFDLTTGKTWGTLISAIDLVERYSTDVSMVGFNKLKQEYKLEVLDIITKGQDAYEKLSAWLEPINSKECLQAIHDCIKVSIGNRKYDQINILKLTDTKSISSPDDTIVLFPNVLEIDSPQALIEYFRLSTKLIVDTLFVTFTKDQRYKNIPHIYLYLLYKNKFYVLNMDEQNLNQSWATGLRSPDRYDHWYHFNNIWLPFKMILKSDKKTESTEIELRKKSVFKHSLLSDIFEKKPEAKVWIDMFLYRVLDYIKNETNVIPLGVTPEEVLVPMLEYKGVKELETNVKLNQVGFEGNIEPMGKSFASYIDPISYLMKKYLSQMTSVVPSIKKVPLMLARKEHIENVILFEQRKLVAEQLQKLVRDDYKKNHKRVYSWFRKLVKSNDLKKIIEKALKDEEYSFHYFGKFPKKEDRKYGEVVNGMRVNLVGNDKIQKRKLLIVYKLKVDSTPYVENDDLNLIMTESKHFWSDYPKRALCSICKKHKWYYIIRLSFIDYMQICEFFNLKEEDLPKEYVEHFHYQNTTKSSLSLHNDDDPAFMVIDPYFREHETHRDVVIFNDNRSDNPEMNIFYVSCKRCFNKFGGKYNE